MSRLLYEKLIVSFLKDKKRFKLLSWTGDKYVDGIYDHNNLNPDIHIQQVINGMTLDYYIECKWSNYWQRDEKGYFYEIDPGQLKRYLQFAQKNKRVVLLPMLTDAQVIILEESISCLYMRSMGTEYIKLLLTRNIASIKMQKPLL